jgi:hypothetical protein
MMLNAASGVDAQTGIALAALAPSSLRAHHFEAEIERDRLDLIAQAI